MGIEGRFEPVLAAALPHARTVLILGAGPGADDRDLRAPGRWVCGVDVDPVILEHPFLDEAVLCEGTSLPFACGSFDLCVARWVVEHVPDPPSVLAEVARVVRPGGHFVFITSNRWFIIPASLQGSLFKAALPHTASYDTVPRFNRANTRPKLRKILSGGGWAEQYLRFEDLCHAITGDFRRV